MYSRGPNCLQNQRLKTGYFALQESPKKCMYQQKIVTLYKLHKYYITWQRGMLVNVQNKKYLLSYKEGKVLKMKKKKIDNIINGSNSNTI